jgi:nitrite reductase/ring-hydroxylating ferredoxin subunit
MTSDGVRLQFLAAVEDIPEGGLGFTYGSGPFPQGGFLVRTEAGVRGWVNRCRHLAVPLDHHDPGRFSTPGGCHLVCSMHGALYRPDDGMCVAGPCEGVQLRPLPIVVDRNNVYLDLVSISEPGPVSRLLLDF